MSATEGVVFAFRRKRERLDAIQFTVGTETLTPACQNLMSVCLMAYIPNDSVVWRIEHIVQCYSKFNYTQTGSQMSRVDRQFLDDVVAQFFA